MNANETFVVVDLETTGQSVTRGGRIIQIGMTFIKQRQIVAVSYTHLTLPTTERV
mgnify:CR=1 FL=1